MLFCLVSSDDSNDVPDNVQSTQNAPDDSETDAYLAHNIKSFLGFKHSTLSAADLEKYKSELSYSHPLQRHIHFRHRAGQVHELCL